jgi:hypothetical protein
LPLANFITATSLSLHTILFPGTDQALIRLVAPDGVNSSSDNSNAVFSIEHNLPTVHIGHADTSLPAQSGAPTVFYATTIDLNDINLDSNKLGWRSNHSIFTKGEAGDAVHPFAWSLAQSTHRSGEPGTATLRLCSRHTPMSHALQAPTPD